MTLIRDKRIFNNEENGGSIISVTGDSVDNTDPANPIINAVPLSGTTPGNEITGDLDFSGALLGLYADNDFEIQGGGVTDYSKSWIYFADTEFSMGFGEVGGLIKNGVYFNEEESQFLWNNNIILKADSGMVSLSNNAGAPLITIIGNQIILNIPTSPAGLVSGAIWNNLGIVTIV
jgi:hypothetical protein